MKDDDPLIFLAFLVQALLTTPAPREKNITKKASHKIIRELPAPKQENK